MQIEWNGHQVIDEVHARIGADLKTLNSTRAHATTEMTRAAVERSAKK
jgi:hypothetical protein